MSIERVNFGRIDAESEVNLADYFVDTGVIDRLRIGRKQYVFGRKGSGKTAIFRTLTNGRLGREVISLDLQDYPWEAHKRIVEDGVSPEASYVTSWKFSFLVAACRLWAEEKTELGDNARKFLERIYGRENPAYFEVLFDKLKRLRKIKLPEVDGVGSLGGFELDEAQSGRELARSLGQWVRELERLVAINAKARPFTIIIDRLDDGWDATDASKNLIIGVLKAARDLNHALMSVVPVAVTVFLRSDIFDELQFNDKNKISADIEHLDWTEAKLIEIMERRISASLGIPQAGAWEGVFSEKEMRQRSGVKSYILRRTMLRPRDIIAFCLNCQEVAVEQRHNIVETTDVYDAEKRYSRHVYNELDDEMHRQVPYARSALQFIRDVGKTRFTLASWIEAVRRRNAAASDGEAIAMLKTLFDYSIVGVERRGGAAGGTNFQFVYNDRLLEPNFDGEMIVHPSLVKELGLTERRAR